MSDSVRKKLLWGLIAGSLFALFYWLFGLGLPGAAFEFAGGATVIILSGLLSSNYAARLWYKSSTRTFSILASCSNALEAKRLLESRPVDLLFLDINMPVLDGLAFVKTLGKPPQVIFTTAYKEFAHQAFDLAACDYLLKPFSLERFIVAVDKARENREPKSKPPEEPVAETHTYLKSDGKIYKLNFDEVRFAEAEGNKVKIVTDSGLIRPAITFAALEELLP